MSREGKVTVDIELIKPYNKSIEVLFQLVNTWGFELISSDTMSRNATIKMTVTQFARIFHRLPEIGKFNIPEGTSSFLDSWNVTNIEEEDDETKN